MINSNLAESQSRSHTVDIVIVDESEHLSKGRSEESGAEIAFCLACHGVDVSVSQVSPGSIERERRASGLLNLTYHYD
ncbi:MAG: hypothetical protein PF501_13015 [Salinisphaera sp.]|jgi:hypothetical protein|nr:hypothetical protein [Salinisphaera sp.]